MRKVIVFIEKEPELRDYFKELDDTFSRSEDQLKFLMGKLDQLKEATEQHHKRLWEQIETHCKRRGLFPDEYQPEHHSLTLDAEIGVLLMEDKKKAPDFMQAMKSLFT